MFALSLNFLHVFFGNSQTIDTLRIGTMITVMLLHLLISEWLGLVLVQCWAITEGSLWWGVNHLHVGLLRLFMVHFWLSDTTGHHCTWKFGILVCNKQLVSISKHKGLLGIKFHFRPSCARVEASVPLTFLMNFSSKKSASWWGSILNLLAS